MRMNCKQTLVLAAAAASLVAGSAIASDIYRYTDADGNVHYVDRPSGADTEQRVAIASRRSAPRPSPSRSVQPQTTAAAAPAQAEAAEPEPTKKTRSEKIAEKKAREERCASYRAKLETMVTSRRLYRETDDGEREYLSDAEIDDARAKAQELIEENCS